MNLFINEFIGGIIWVIVFSIIPFLWWFMTARKKERFFQWIGIKKIETENRNRFLLYTGFCIIFFLIFGILLLYMTKDIETATSKFKGLGFIGLPSVLVYAFLGTALSEEILFRGFLTKRLVNKLGFKTGNLIQGILFGLVHIVLIILGNITGIVVLIVIGVFTGLTGWFMGYINERLANGSILPGWIIHGLANTFSSIVVLFSLI